MELTLEQLRDTAFFNIFLVGVYGTMFINTKKPFWAVGGVIFLVMALVNIETIMDRKEDGKSIFEEQHLQTSQSKRVSGYNRPCCPPQELGKNKTKGSLPSPKLRKNPVHGERDRPTFKYDPNPYQPLRELDVRGECVPCPTN